MQPLSFSLPTRVAPTDRCQYCGQPLARHRVHCIDDDGTFTERMINAICSCDEARIQAARQRDMDEAVNRRAQRKVQAERNFLATIPERFHQVPESDLIRPGQSLILSGATGVGKTHTACSIAKAFIMRDLSTIFTTDIDLLMEIRSTFNDKQKGTEEAMRSRYVSADLLIIDDFGKAKPTEWALEQIYAIIDSRYRNIRSTIFTTNYTSQQLRARWDGFLPTDAILSRLKDRHVRHIRMEGPDRRVACIQQQQLF